MAGEYEAYVGKNIFIRTVTMYYVGELVAVNNRFFTLKNAAWVAETGRFSEAMSTGKFGQVELYPADLPVNVQTSGMIDFNEYRYPLPLKS